MRELDRKIQRLNSKNYPVIFVVTGNNSSGKTTITKKIIQQFNFYQTINLGIISKMLKFFKPEIDASELENFNGNSASKIFKLLVDFMVKNYKETGVNTIIDGVQIDTNQLEKNDDVIGGVILDVSDDVALNRGIYPQTHFKRKIFSLKKVNYKENLKFIRIDNNGTLGQTFKAIINHLDRLLDQKLLSYEKNRV